MVEFEGEITHEDNKTDSGRYPYYRDRDGAVYVIVEKDGEFSAVVVFDPEKSTTLSPGLPLLWHASIEHALSYAMLKPAKNFTLKVRTK